MGSLVGSRIQTLNCLWHVFIVVTFWQLHIKATPSIVFYCVYSFIYCVYSFIYIVYICLLKWYFFLAINRNDCIMKVVKQFSTLVLLERTSVPVPLTFYYTLYFIVLFIFRPFTHCDQISAESKSSVGSMISVANAELWFMHEYYNAIPIFRRGCSSL